MRTIITTVTLGSLLAIPAFVYGAGIDYVSITESQDDTVKLKRSTLSSVSWYQCSVTTRQCTDTASTTPLSVATTTTGTAARPAWRDLLPAGSSWVATSPDGAFAAFYIPGSLTRGKRTFGILDIATSHIYTKDEVLEYWDLLTEGIRIFSFSPDSKTLLYIDDIKKNPTLYRVVLDELDPASDTFTSTRQFERDYTIADVAWVDADTFLFIANRDTPYQWNLYTYTRSTKALKKIADNASFAVNIKKNGSVFLYAEATETGVRPKIYNPSTDTVSDFSLPAIESTKTKGAHISKLKGGLQGTFFLEQSGHSDTLLVWLHGGPYRQTSLTYHPYLSYGGYDWLLEQARSADVGVLKIDYPGSAGFGRPFAESIMGKVGAKDTEDTAKAIADFAARNKYKKVYLMGNSYGGYLALKLLVTKPRAYAGALSVNGVADWTTMLTALDNSIFNKQFNGTVNDDNYQMYARASIYNHLDALTNQKIILAHGTKDMTIPFKQSEGLAIALKAINKPAQLLLFEGEDHVFKKPESFETLCRATLAFVGKTESNNACDL